MAKKKATKKNASKKAGKATAKKGRGRKPTKPRETTGGDSCAPRKSAIRIWADAVETSLIAKSSLARQFSHRGLIGEGRENLLIDLLTQFLPSTVSVGRGQLMDSEGARSDQIDIILSRSDAIRLPITETGSALYLLESALSVLEVKSTLDAKSLAEAMKTLASPSRLQLVAQTPDPRSPSEIESGGPLNAIGVHKLEQLGRFLYPSTYLYAFTGKSNTTARRLPEILRDAILELQIPLHSLPSVVAFPGAVAIRNDQLLLGPGDSGKDWDFAIREEPLTLYWVLIHILRRLQIVFGDLHLSGLSSNLLLHHHLAEIPDDWKLLILEVNSDQ